MKNKLFLQIVTVIFSAGIAWGLVQAKTQEVDKIKVQADTTEKKVIKLEADIEATDIPLYFPHHGSIEEQKVAIKDLTNDTKQIIKLPLEKHQ